MDDPMDDEARKLAADKSAEAIREAYAREQAAAADDDDKAAPLVQGVDDEWADWRGCVCGGSYYGEMVACEGGCDNWFHFACVGITRLPRGEFYCEECKARRAAKRRRLEAAASTPRPKPKRSAPTPRPTPDARRRARTKKSGRRPAAKPSAKRLTPPAPRTRPAAPRRAARSA